MKLRSRAFTASIFCGACLCLVGSAAWAEGDDNAADMGDTLQLDPIIVDGTRVFGMPPSQYTGGYAVDAVTVGARTATQLRGIPQSVSVITHERIEDQELKTLDDMARTTPGLNVLTNDSGRSSIYARGYEYNEFNIDGLPAPMASINGTLPSLAAVDRVEILRGPSGLLSSTSELGGIVNLVLKRPTYELQGELEGRYGSFNQYYLSGDISGPLADDGRLRGRLVVVDNATDGFVDYNENKARTFYGALAYDFTPDTTAFVAFLRDERDITVNNGVATDPNGELLDLPRSTFFGARWNDFQGRNNDLIGELKHDFSQGGQGRVAARYSDRDASCNYAFGGGALAADGTVPVKGLGCDVSETALSLDASYSRTFDLFGNPGEYVLGLDHKRYKTDAARVRAKLGTVALDDFPNLPYVDIMAQNKDGSTKTDLRETGLYAKTTIRPIEPLAVIAGLRVSRYRIEQTKTATNHTESQHDNSKLTPYAGLIYDLSKHYSLYTSYTEVFTPQTAYDKQGDLLQPRTGRQYEVGAKASYLDGDFNARVSAFRLYDKNHAATVPGEGYSASLDSRRVQGVEFQVNGSPAPGLELIAGYTYLDTQVEPGKISKGDPAGIYLLMPKHSFKLWTKYTFADGALDGLSLGAGVTAQSGISSSQGIQSDSYVFVDAMVGYQFTEQLSGQLNFNNIFDEKYYNRVGSEGTFNFYGPPANVVASIRYNF